MKPVTFVAIIGAAIIGNFFAVMLLPLPLLILLGNILLFGGLSVFSGKRIHRASLVLNVTLAILLAAIVVYPRVLSLRAHTPQEHMTAAGSLVASWRAPFISERAAWPHYLAAAEGGIAYAELIVGTAYLYRHFGAPFDRKQARRWLESAASHGSIEAQRELANVDTVPGT